MSSTSSSTETRGTSTTPSHLLNNDEEEPPLGLATTSKPVRPVQLSLFSVPNVLSPPPAPRASAEKSAAPGTGPGKSPQPRSQTARWQDWRWQLRHRIRTLDQLFALFPRLKDEASLNDVVAKYPMAITPYYASLIRRTDPSDPIFQMAVPRFNELMDPPFLSADPLHEEENMPVPGLIHRYQDRALVMATTLCAMYCRHCTRKRVAGTRQNTLTSRQMNHIAAYLRAHPEISDVIISGGDPLTIQTEILEAVVAQIRQVPSVEIIRIGTRTPVVLPQRITDELTHTLQRYHPIWINTHFNHPNELTPESAEACARLVDAGFPLGNQTVLLRGINDDPKLMADLCRGLVRMRVRPYYLFQCDLVRGIEHFRTPVAQGLEIMEYLRGRIGGLAIPTYVVDAPHGGGKIPVLPQYLVSMSPTHTVLRNSQGMMVSCPEPSNNGSKPAQAPSVDSAPDVWHLATGEHGCIKPVPPSCRGIP